MMPPQGGAPVTPVDKQGNVIGSTSAPSVTTVQGNDGTTNRTLLTDNAGRQQVVPYVGTVAIGSAVTNADAQAVSATANSLRVSSYSLIFNGTTFDRQRKANLYSRVASSAAAGNPAVGKASPGDVRQFWGQNGAAVTYLQIYNKATAPVIGTDTPILTFPIPASTVFSQSLGDGAYLAAGISYAFTTDAAGTAGAAAAAVVAFALVMS